MPDGRTIQSKFDAMKRLFSTSPLDPGITALFKEINDLCQNEVSAMQRLPLTSNTTARGKNYVLFSHNNGKKSRPVNIDLYNEGIATDADGNSKVYVFWENVSSQTIANQPARDITTALYVIAMNYCTCADTLPGLKNNAGAYFEKLIGHLYARHLGINPSTQMNAVELDGESIPLPTDFIFNLGPGKPKLHIPVKTSTRERVVEVWAQQRILDGAFGVGRFFCLLTCIGETNLGKNMSIDITCVPNQWMNYQLFVAQITRAYYLDMPEKYRELNDRFPKIHVKEFGEYFHESEHLFD